MPRTIQITLSDQTIEHLKEIAKHVRHENRELGIGSNEPVTWRDQVTTLFNMGEMDMDIAISNCSRCNPYNGDD